MCADFTVLLPPPSQSPKAGHNKAGRSDFRNQRFEPDTGKMRKMQKALSSDHPTKTRVRGDSTERKCGKRGKCGYENAENADDWLQCDWLQVTPKPLPILIPRTFILDIFETPTGPPDPRGPKPPSNKKRKKFQKPRKPRYFPKSKRYLPQSKPYPPKSERSCPKSKRLVFLGSF